MMEMLGAEFEKASGERLDIEFATVGSLRKRIEGGEQADLVAMSESAIAAVNTPGRFAPGSVTNLGKTVTGVAVRQGAPKPDISTVDAFNKALLAARTVSYTDPKAGGSSGIYFDGYLVKAGLADAVRAKAVPGQRGNDVAHLIADGKAELGLTFISEFLMVPGVAVVGPLPPGIENVNMYAAAIPATSSQQAKAAAFLKALTAPASRERWKAAGLEPAF
jgi:molybdate transport system substrate-binding protein